MPALSNRGEIPTGNPEAAQDLYGLGVRVGFYLQGLGVILYDYDPDDEVEDTNTATIRGSQEIKNEYGKGLTIASTSIALAILASWFVFAARAEFSAAESVIILLIISSVLQVAMSTLPEPRVMVRELTGVVTVLLTKLGLCTALLWTFAVLVKRLPPLGTKNLVFFFTPIVVIIICEYRRDRMPTERGILQISDILGWEKDRMTPYVYALRHITWMLTVLAVELTIHWNHLSPTRDLLVPGQLIPFVAGVVILIDSGIIAGRSLLPGYRKALRSWEARTLRTAQSLRDLS
ncbi:hypothetical protein TEQG_06549 [Trichophyton equinum CBS 127.97]|uniref:Uncharacterized protein n=1 Tax=Trichophyton equinum (strain ATCC MYA-4606 / CBS 127.97) TaxID=559882 RepID=F2PZV5_TRIEC|nr:hypothetical protein TEQG_06549 [Trichophyton equinum CBS 127.97]